MNISEFQSNLVTVDNFFSNPYNLLIYLVILHSLNRTVMIREVEIPRNEYFDTLNNPGKVSGFVSPTEDYAQKRLHIAQRLVNDLINTFYFEADQMRYFGIMKGCIIVLNKTLPLKSETIIVCCVDDDGLTRKVCTRGNSHFL